MVGFPEFRFQGIGDDIFFRNLSRCIPLFKENVFFITVQKATKADVGFYRHKTSLTSANTFVHFC